jgi:hypothetical protein
MSSTNVSHKHRSTAQKGILILGEKSSVLCHKYIFVHNMDTERRKSLKSRKIMHIKHIYETNAQVRSILRVKSMLQELVLKLWTTTPVWTRAENLAPHRGSIPGPSSPYPFAIPAELPGPYWMLRFMFILKWNQN